MTKVTLALRILADFSLEACRLRNRGALVEEVFVALAF